MERGKEGGREAERTECVKGAHEAAGLRLVIVMTSLFVVPVHHGNRV